MTGTTWARSPALKESRDSKVFQEASELPGAQDQREARVKKDPGGSKAHKGSRGSKGSRG